MLQLLLTAVPASALAMVQRAGGAQPPPTPAEGDASSSYAAEGLAPVDQVGRTDLLSPAALGATNWLAEFCNCFARETRPSCAIGPTPGHCCRRMAGLLPAVWGCRLSRAEWSGSQQLLWLESPADLLRMLWPATSLPPQWLDVGWAIVVFDTHSGERLRRTQPAWSRDLIRSVQE